VDKTKLVAEVAQERLGQAVGKSSQTLW
jgi:hypothetical protein